MRKLAHVRFVAGMAHRFMDRLFAAEESDHQEELATHREFGSRVSDLRKDHVKLRGELSRVLLQLDHACADDKAACGEVFTSLHELAIHIRAHTHREISLLQDSVDLDFGGQG